MFSFMRNLSKDQKRLLSACYFSFFLNGTMTLMLGSVMPDLRSAYQLTATQGGLLISSYSTGNFISGMIAGLLSLFWGQRRSVVAFALSMALGFALVTVWGNPLFLMISFVFTGLGRGGIANFNNGTVNKISNGSPSASNLLHACFAIGALTAPMIFLLTSGIGGWRMPLFYIVALALCVAFYYRLQHFDDDDRPIRKDKTQSTMVFMKNPSFLILCAMMFFYLCAEYSINGWLVTFLQNKVPLVDFFAKHPTSSLAAYSQTMATALWVAILTGRLTCAALSARVPQKHLMLIASIGVTACFAIMLFGNSIAVVTVSIIGLGLCMAGICPLIYSDAGIFSNAYPMAISALLAIGSSGSILMPTIVGMTANAFGYTGGMATILFVIICLLVCAILNVTVKTRMPEPMTQTEGEAA